MFERPRRCFRHKFGSLAATVDDPVLGVLSWSETGQAWLSNPEHAGLGFTFQICGTPLPSPAHIRHAALIVAQKEEFVRRVQRLQAVEAATVVGFRRLKGEIAALKIGSVSLCWEDLPGHGLAGFEGGRDDRRWTCYCFELTPKELSFNSR